MKLQESAWRVDFSPADEDGYDSLSEHRHSGSEAAGVALTPEMLEELLDPEEWSQVLSTYAGTMSLAVLMTDCEGKQLGRCHNPQPTWTLANAAPAPRDAAAVCTFCLGSAATNCYAVKTALDTGRVELARDYAGLVHLAIPLVLGEHRIGALIAGQVFDGYPEPLRLQVVARQLGVLPQRLWEQARQQVPIRNATLQVYGELLFSLAKAFLRQRYAAILDRRLEQANLRLRLAVDGVKDHALFTVDETGLITSWNLGAKRLYGYSRREIAGQNFSLLFTEEDSLAGVPAQLLERASRDAWVNDEVWQIRKDGTRFLSQGSLASLGTGGAREFGRLTHDITDQHAAEEALRQSQKLESIGVLASGIAHDFNNLLAGIVGGVTLSMSSLPLEHAAYAPLVIAQTAAEKAATLTGQLLAHAGQGKFVVTRFDFSRSIREVLRLLQTSIPKSVELKLDILDDLPWIEADASQIQQIIMNLVINGGEAIGPEGGWLRISTRLDSSGPIPYVCLEVTDSGSGMTEATMSRIFDPFFTTKLTGRGLGLAAVSGIVRSHGGTLQVESALGKGSTFKICFPAVERGIEAPVKVAATAVKTGGTILVVDDEHILRTLAKAILELAGYRVLLAEDGRQALDVFREHAGTISMILLDMTMPVMSGDKAFRLIREISPNVPVVISTGYGETMTRELFSAGAKVDFIQKPFTAAQLREKVWATAVFGAAVNGAGR